MKRHPADLFSILSFLASGGLAGFSVPLGALFPVHGPEIVNSAAIVTAAAGAMLRVFYNPIGAPAQSIVAGAPTVPPK